MSDFDYLAALAYTGRVFTPGAPISQRDSFAGRPEQLRRLLEVIPAAGRHPIIYGERGVGKTSLANILTELFENIVAVKISCDGGDTFESIWNRVLNNASLEFKEQAFGFSREQVTTKTTLRTLLPNVASHLSPSDIACVFDASKSWTIIILDEFDRVTDEEARRSTADVIKIISDNNPLVTIVPVGVAASISQLIGHHPSIERNLVQLELPTMGDEEIRNIVSAGCQRLKLEIDDEVLNQVAMLSNGYPHYAHLLGLSATKACLQQRTRRITSELFKTGCEFAIQDAIEKYRDAYAKATATTKPSRYPKILCACACADQDDRGVFRATEVVEAMHRVFGQRVTVQAVVPALGEFCAPARGQVLSKVPVGKRSHYRLSDQMMRPFLRIKAQSLLSSG